MLLPVIAIGLWTTYALLILRYLAAWRAAVPFAVPEGHVPQTTVSVVIAARNEEHSISDCLSDILAQDYPSGLFEVIVVDDHSTDNTASHIEGFSAEGVRLIRLSSEGQMQAGKKAALTAAVQAARGTLILATDADCRMGPTWLRTMAACHELGDLDFIAAPVRLLEGGGALGTFQCLDFLSLQGITAAAVGAGYHGMCNGANLGYRKSVFEAVGGFEGIDNIASGDDMLLMQKVASRSGTHIGYCLSPDAIVSTPPADGLRAFLQQRIRWASKARFYEERRIFLVLLLVWLANLSLPLLAVAGLLHDPSLLRTAGWLLLGKTVVELAFLWPVAGFFGMRRSLVWFPAAQPFHVVYTVLAGLLGQMGTYQWKGRRVR
jgi:cellulose synthase/poly-beta-1,6-N-acetylglucosamine synthase-like glycosyltransferase